MSHELYHSGVLGMKWGVRRFQNKDGSLTKAGKERYDSDDKKSKERKGLSDGQKKAIKAGLAVAGTALAAYGGYKLYQSGKLDPALEKAGLKGKAFSVDELRAMGIQAFEPDRIQIDRVTPNLTNHATKQVSSGADAFDRLSDAVTKEMLSSKPFSAEQLTNHGTKSISKIKSFKEVFGETSDEKLNKIFDEATKKTVKYNNRYKDSAEEFTKSLLNKNLRDLEKLDLY